MLSKEAIDEDSITYIAIVEDDESLCRSLARLLAVSGYHPVTYSSAEAFLEDTKQPAFDCLIVDVQLDGMSGPELGKLLQERGVATPLIFLTAHEDWEAIEQSIESPYACLLRKSDLGHIVLAAIKSSMGIVIP